jgi:hypothetical protein
VALLTGSSDGKILVQNISPLLRFKKQMKEKINNAGD